MLDPSTTWLIRLSGIASVILFDHLARSLARSEAASHESRLASKEFTCSGSWLQTRERLVHLLTGVILDVVLLAEVAQAEIEEREKDADGSCLLGHVSLHVALLLREPAHVVDVGQALDGDWRVLRAMGWTAVVRSGWPIFQLLRGLQRHSIITSSGKEDVAESVRMRCEEPNSNSYSALLLKFLGHALPPTESGIGASSLAYIAGSGSDTCPLTLAAAFVYLAWSRLPVYDLESDALLQQAERQVRHLRLQDLLAVTDPMFGILSWLSAAYQLSLHQRTLPDPSVQDGLEVSAGQCVVPFARTPSGRCNVFAAIDRDLHIWRAHGIHLEDVARAFRPVTDQKMILFRLIGDEFVQITPLHSHLDAEFGATEPACLANAILSVIAKADLPDFDMVLSHGDLPTLRRAAGRPPFYGPMDRDARIPAPLFSICSSTDFWDILFPNVCRPALVNMSAMSSVAWKKKTDVAFWRGTDRGAVNWAVELRDMYHGSPRKRFVDTWTEDNHFDVAFLDDDLLNASVVNTDPNFVPLDRWPEWRYLLDLPGNGYSGSLKQKLTSSAAVLLLTDIGISGASPVYEHYHVGLQDKVHVLHISISDAGEKVRWASEHEEKMQLIVRQANEYMTEFEDISQCYIWRLLDQYAQLMRYRPSHDQAAIFGADLSERTLQIHRRPLKHEAAAFRARCKSLFDKYSM